MSTVDCSNPHALARFWATGFGYVIEGHGAQIEELLAAATPPTTT